MQVLVRRLTGWAYNSDNFVKRWRAERMQAFLGLVQPPPRARVVDLGGTEYVWRTIEHDFFVTLVNLPGGGAEKPTPRFRCVEGDACALGAIFEDGEFDVVFSNSTIEHVGDATRRAAFAREVRRIGRGYWVQTPSDRCPIEVHTGVPFYWRLPTSWRGRLHRKWARTLPGWYRMIAETRVLALGEMQRLFPDGEIYRERRFGFEKSYALYCPFAER